MKNLFTLIIYLIIFTFSCKETKIEMEIPGGNNTIVLNGTLCPDSLVNIILSKSKNIQDTSPFEKISGSIVNIYKNDSLIEMLKEIQKGEYSSQEYKPEAGAGYKIKVYSKGGLIECNDSIPSSAKIERVDTSWKDNNLICTIRFIESASSQYYFLRIIKKDNTSTSFLKFVFYNEYDPSPDTFKFFETSGNYGKSKELIINIPNPGKGIIKIELSSINKAFYQYQRTVETLFENMESTNWFMENLQIKSNIQGGKGILAAFSNESFQLEIP